MSKGIEYSDEQIKALLEAIHSGEITADDLSHDLTTELYEATKDYFSKGAFEGYGGTLADFSGSQYDALSNLLMNVKLFSGAKTFQTVYALESMIDDDGKKRSFKDFFEVAKDEYKLRNEAWARTEYGDAVKNSFNVSKWNKIEAQADILPTLIYSAVGGGGCDICPQLDGLEFDIKDPALNTIAPQNHPNCMCVLLQGSEPPKEREDKDELVDSATENMNDAYKFNPGKEQTIWSEKNPTFDIPKGYEEAALNNFGLPMGDDDE